MDVKIAVPEGAGKIISELTSHGHRAYVVGGCVRDCIMGKAPHDWDICTSATPEQVKAVINAKTIDTGIKHGTVTIEMPDGYYEVTTFRIDGSYSDGRRPDWITYTDDLKEDLSRRDFKMNAIAYNGIDGIVDPFGGVQDITNGVISCVGNPDHRFQEDALRIMRAIRFASVFGFQISEEAKASVKRNVQLLSRVSSERIHTELTKIVCGSWCRDILLEYPEVICAIMPEYKACYGFNQNNPYHQYTVYDHIAHAVGNYQGDDVSVKYALLFHDIGKPLCYTENESGGHFKKHSVYSYDLANQIMRRLKFESAVIEEVGNLVLYHDATIKPRGSTIRKWLHKLGEKTFRRLLDVQKADILAHAEGTQESRLERLRKAQRITDKVIEEGQCFSLKDLTIKGRDLIELGFIPGKHLGDVLNALLDRVINGELENDHTTLKNAAIEYLNHK